MTVLRYVHTMKNRLHVVTWMCRVVVPLIFFFFYSILYFFFVFFLSELTFKRATDIIAKYMRYILDAGLLRRIDINGFYYLCASETKIAKQMYALLLNVVSLSISVCRVNATTNHVMTLTKHAKGMKGSVYDYLYHRFRLKDDYILFYSLE